MNLLDWVLLLLVAGFAASGLLKGIVRQAFSLGGLVLGHLAASRWHGEARSLLHIDFPGGEAAAYLAVFVASWLAVRVVGSVVEQRVRASALSGGDRLLGGLLGAVTGTALSVLLVFLLSSVLPADASLLRGSRVAPYAARAARAAAPLLPEKVRSPFLSRHLPPPHGAPEGAPSPGRK